MVDLGRYRTPYLRCAKAALSHLSYRPWKWSGRPELNRHLSPVSVPSVHVAHVRGECAASASPPQISKRNIAADDPTGQYPDRHPCPAPRKRVAVSPCAIRAGDPPNFVKQKTPLRFRGGVLWLVAFPGFQLGGSYVPPEIPPPVPGCVSPIILAPTVPDIE